MHKIKADKWGISRDSPCFIIAEAGSNHNGSLRQAKELIDVARDAGADAVKFQLFRAKTMYPNRPISVKYLKNIGIKEGLYGLIKKYEVPYFWIKELYVYAKKKNINFLATPFDLNSVEILNPYVDIFKIASYESMFSGLINKVKETGKPIFISTGGSTEEEIDLLVNNMLSDYKDKAVLLHCLAKYPAPVQELNLNMITHFAEKYGILSGYSDHTENPVIAPVVAVCRGAKVIEKHFTLSKSLPGPDHAFAVEPDGLKEMVKSIRLAEKMLKGNKEKRSMQPCEDELHYYKRCIYVKNNLKKGHRIKNKDLVVLRNTGERCNYFNPIEADLVIGRVLKHARKPMQILRREDLE